MSCSQNLKVRWPTTVTSKINCSHQKQIAHIKFKLLTSKANCSHQIQIAHIKNKLLTSKTNCSHQKQIAHIKFKLLTSKTNCSHQIQIPHIKSKLLIAHIKIKNKNKIITHWSAATLKRLSPVFTRFFTSPPFFRSSPVVLSFVAIWQLLARQNLIERVFCFLSFVI